MCVASPASHSTVREGLNLPVWSWRDYGMLLYSARALPEGLHTQVCPCERGRAQVCSVTRVLQHCARGIEPASGVGETTVLMYSARALREGLHTQLYPCESWKVQVCSVTRVLQHCARGIEPASMELAGPQHVMFSARALRKGWHTQSVPLRELKYTCV